MPSASPKTCSRPGCGGLVRGGTCGVCGPKVRTESDRGSAAKRGYGRRWRKLRLMYLSANPLCVECEKKGTIRSANILDHIIPHKGDFTLFWDTSNFQALCKSCHDSKTIREDGGFGRAVGGVESLQGTIL